MTRHVCVTTVTGQISSAMTSDPFWAWLATNVAQLPAAATGSDPRAAQAPTLEQALALLDRGASSTLIVSVPFDGAQIALSLEQTDHARARGVHALVDLRGYASHARRGMPAERPHRPDPIDDSARALRRALADGRLKARELGCVFVSVEQVGGDRQTAERVIKRALGRHSGSIPVVFTPSVDRGGTGVAVAACVLAVACGSAPGVEFAGSAGLAIGLAADTITALAFSEPR